MAPRNKPVETPAEDLDLTAQAAEIFAGEGINDPVVDVGAAKSKLIAKLANIMASMPTLKPEGRNTFHNYAFIKDTQVSGAVRPRMAKAGLVLIPDVIEESWVETKTAKGGTSWVTKLKVKFTIIDAESGESISGHGIGYGDDSGDKGANKAFTAAEKYWLMKTFQIGGEDLEDDEQTDKRSAERQAGQLMQADNGQRPNIVGTNVTGVQVGGRQDGASKAQVQAIGASIKALNLTAAETVAAIQAALDDVLELVEDDKTNSDTIKAYLAALSGDDAGKLLTALQDMKDQRDEEPGGGYGG
jgi:hypothetical protein